MDTIRKSALKLVTEWTSLTVISFNIAKIYIVSGAKFVNFTDICMATGKFVDRHTNVCKIPRIVRNYTLSM